jgi:hypothetical protein
VRPHVDLSEVGVLPLTVSFQHDIVPLFSQFQGQMMWRFDLTNYEHVRANAKTIFSRISDPGFPMPPPPLKPLSGPQVELFASWIREGYPP